MKTIYLLTSAFLCLSGVGLSIVANAQCGVPTPPSYVACGSRGQSALARNSTVFFNDYYYSGFSTTLTGVGIYGSTLYICGTVTLTAPTLFGGTIIVEPGGTLTINGDGGNTSGTEIVNWGSLTINNGSAASTISSNADIYNYGYVDFIGSLSMSNGNNFYNASSGSSLILTGNLTTAGAMVNNGDITVDETYEFASTLCMGGGSQLGVNKLDDAGNSKVTVSATPSGATATIGITTSLTSRNALTNTVALVLCEGPHFTAGGNAGSATIDHNCTLTTLPITLVSFSAKAENNICALQWRTTQQKGLVSFEVQYSTDAVTYQTLAILPAEQETESYSYTTPITQNTWFRLRMANEDSSYAYSTIVPVNFKGGAPGEAAYALRVQPNLVTGNTLEVWSNMAAGQSGEWWVVDMMGRTMLRRPAQLSAGTAINTIQLPTLFSGIYRLLFVGSQVRLSPVPFSVIR